MQGQSSGTWVHTQPLWEAACPSPRLSGVLGTAGTVPTHTRGGAGRGAWSGHPAQPGPQESHSGQPERVALQVPHRARRSGGTRPSESTAVTEATPSLPHRLTLGPRGSPQASSGPPTGFTPGPHPQGSPQASSEPTRPLSTWACSQGLRTSSKASPCWWAGELGPRRLSPGLRTSPGPGP